MAAAVTALNKLLRGASIDDHEEALRLADAAIDKAKPGAADRLTAQHTKVVALLKLDRFGDVLRTVAEGGDALAERCVLERVYALYKMGELEEAAALAGEGLHSSSSSSSSSTSTSSRGLKHVAAQIAYRDEQFETAAALYRELGASSATEGQTGEETDVRINALATAAQRGWSGDVVVDEDKNSNSRGDLDAFETAYNAGCRELASGRADRASVLLRRAQQLCEASDDLTDDDKQTELLPILVQQAYALTQLGRHTDAAALQRAVADVAGGEASTRVVAATNAVVETSITTTAQKNPYLLQAQLDTLPKLPIGSDRLFAHQAAIVRRNHFAVELQCFKFKGVQSRTTQRLKKLAQAPNPAAAHVTSEAVNLGVFQAAAKAQLQTGKAALQRIQPLLKSENENEKKEPPSVGLVLTAVQLHLQQSNPDAAAAVLETFFRRTEEVAPAVRFAPGLVALAVALYKLQGRHQAVRTVLAQAVAFWKEQKKTTTTRNPLPTTLLRAAGVELLQSSVAADHAVAASAFEELHAADPSDRVAAAGLVAATSSSSSTNSKKHSDLIASLTPVDQLVQGIDVAQLLKGGVAVAPTTTTTATATAKAKAGKKRGAPTAEEGTTASKKTKTATATTTTEPPKLSRQARKLQAKREASSTTAFDPNKKLDPERWLPLRDRSSYRPPKGKKGKNRRAQGGPDTMQGGLVKEEETLALAGGAGSVKVEKASTSGGGGGGSGKKRKKGKK